MAVDKSTLIKLVRQEAKNIKENATKQEIERLKIKSLDPSNTEGCIYGQMTGNCYSERANALIVKCATKVYKSLGTRPLDDVELSEKHTGLVKQLAVIHRDGLFHSPIEIFIYQQGYDVNFNVDRSPKGNISRLINYLQGKTKTLTIK